MKTNVGKVDRAIRLVLGVLLLLLPFISGWAVLNSGVGTAVSVILGIVMLATSAIKICPIYWILGIQTCKL